jgi:hypothetical protein
MHELVKAQLAIAKVSVDFTIDQGLGSKAEDVYVSVVTKVLGPAKLISDAYPDIWDKQLNAMRPHQVRTAETDTSFRKTVVPRGSVKLTAPAVAQIRSFMHEARKLTPKDDLVAALGWTTRQRSKGSEDKTWTSIPDGLLLGAFPRSQLPPDVIDKVDGIEIVLTADSPDRLAGKTIDFQKGQFVIRD